MIFVNKIAEITHRHVINSGGHPNKNIGDAFLLVWKLKSGKNTHSSGDMQKGLFDSAGNQRSIWTVEAQETFYNAAIVHGMGRWSKIADSIPNIDTLQDKNFGNVYEDRFPTEYEKIVISHKAHVYNLSRRKTTTKLLKHTPPICSSRKSANKSNLNADKSQTCVKCLGAQARPGRSTKLTGSAQDIIRSYYN
jgi:hypothetical protein